MECKLVLPTVEQVQWADSEIGVIIHLDLTTFRPGYRFREHFGDPIPAAEFDPKQLDTDQWLAAASALGAKYAVLVAKHCTGFSLWPTNAHDYHVGNSPYKNGQGDIVAEFVASCEKFDIRPGIYCSVSFNQYYSVENPGTVIDGDPVKQQAYNEMVLKQLTELWTNYGKLFEIWFDGGVLPVEEGGPDVVSLLHRLQPDAVVFQGPVGTKSLIRWVGNERGVAPEDCSALCWPDAQMDNGTVEREDVSCADGEIWSPAESDFPNRNAETSYMGGWFWRDGEEAEVLPAEHLFDCYLTSVGRNTNMLVGMVIDIKGRFPDRDASEFAKAGAMIRDVFGSPLAVKTDGKYSVSVADAENREAGYAAIGEDITQGERVQGYILRGYNADGEEIFTHQGRVIGHKRILPLSAGVVRVALEITESRAEPVIKFMELYPRA